MNSDRFPRRISRAKFYKFQDMSISEALSQALWRLVKMTRIGVVEIKEMDYDEVMKGIAAFLEEHSPDKVDESKNSSYWYEGDKEATGRINIEKYYTFDFWTRRIIQGVDALTKKVTENIRTQNRKLCAIKKKEENTEHSVYLVADQGSANAITEISKELKLDVSMRRKISFDEDFIEFLNTADPAQRDYSTIFGNDMESTSRKAKKGKHRVIEGYLDLSLRESTIKEPFREAAGVRIVPPVHLARDLPTMEVVLYDNGWLNCLRPKREDDQVVYYEAVLYSVARLSLAFNKFAAL